MRYAPVPFDPNTHVIVHVHIPKTGGSTLTRIFKDAFGRDRVQARPNENLEGFEAGLLRVQNRLRLAAERRGERIAGLFARAAGRRPPRPVVVSGHASLAGLPGDGRTALPIALVRRPADRLVSEYWFTKDKLGEAGGRSRDPKKRLVARLSVNEYAEHVIRNADRLPVNNQCRFLAGTPSFAAAREVVDDVLWLAAPLPRFDRFVEMIEAGLGLTLPRAAPRNRSRLRPDGEALDPVLAARLDRIMNEDAMLCDHIEEAFDALAAANDPLAGRAGPPAEMAAAS